MEAMALIEIDGLPFLKMGGSFHGKLLVSHNQMVLLMINHKPYIYHIDNHYSNHNINYY